jgi:hypothetical protein
MITSKEYAEKTGVTLTTVKRWGREFLPPITEIDRAGKQVKVWTDDEAFKIYLGGHMVSELGFSVSETRIAINELWSWLKEHGLTPNLDGFYPSKEDFIIQEYELFAKPTNLRDGSYNYTLNGVAVAGEQSERNGVPVLKYEYVRKPIISKGASYTGYSDANIRIIRITRILFDFFRQLQGSEVFEAWFAKRLTVLNKNKAE